MTNYSMPVEQFVAVTIVKPAIAEVMNGWRFEQKVLEDILVSALKEMGIFLVPQTHKKLITQAIIAQLKNSPVIMRMLKQAQREAMMKAQSRHSV
jgi:hypothetical protein